MVASDDVEGSTDTLIYCCVDSAFFGDKVEVKSNASDTSKTAVHVAIIVSPGKWIQDASTKALAIQGF